MVFRGKVRGGIADAAFGRVRLLPVIAHGDSRTRPPEPEMRGQSTHLESQWAPLAPPIPTRARRRGRDPIRPNGQHIDASATGY